MAGSILWYDLETFGLDSRYDRIAQFAAARTDESLEPTGERLILYCKPTPDYLPSPQSCLVHGIAPQHALEAGLREYDFARAIRGEMTKPGTAAAGFNTLQFDDEFVRNLLYRNLFDPYEREWKNGNSRWDIIDLMRAARDLRPEGIVWPEGEGGRPIFTLVALARANGIAHESAHDAMHDVLATIELARLVRARQPKLFEWYWTHRTRDSLRPLVDLVDRTPLVHTCAAYTSERGCTSLVAPVSVDPENRNQLVALDLRRDVSPIVDLPVEEIRRRAFAKGQERDGERLPVSLIRLNRCPFLAPLSALSETAARRLGIDQGACLERLRAIRARPELIGKIAAAFEIRDPPEPSPDPELRLYAGSFLPERDAEALEKAHAAIGELGAAGAKEKVYKMRFADERPAQMLRRLYARNFPETLGAAEKERWRS
ncbi:MAG: exodeoxyribonuclease I, partial [Spirochaetaceae bacterium]|nr:exodeoxyribonuclease I [Spirochaetaceae bacterium]